MSLELDVGELKGRFSGMETRMEKLENKVDALDAKVDMILEKVSEAKGGWKVISLAITGAGALGMIALKLLAKALA